MMKSLALISQLGLSMASCVLVGVLIGKFLDRLLGTAPWLLLVFAFLGSAAAFKTLYDIVHDWNESS